MPSRSRQFSSFTEFRNPCSEPWLSMSRRNAVVDIMRDIWRKCQNFLRSRIMPRLPRSPRHAAMCCQFRMHCAPSPPALLALLHVMRPWRRCPSTTKSENRFSSCSYRMDTRDSKDKWAMRASENGTSFSLFAIASSSMTRGIVPRASPLLFQLF